MSRLTILVLAAALAVASSAPAEPSTSPVPIVRQVADGPNPDGSYSYSFEAGNGIKADEQGQPKNVGSENETMAAQGGYSFTGPDGQTYEVRYVADENGFQPQGAHLPVAPAIPEPIQRALEWIATHPQEDEEKPAAKKIN